MTGMVETVGLRLILDSLRELGLFSFFGILLILNLPSILYSTVKIFKFQTQTTKNLDTFAKFLPNSLYRPQMGSKLHKFANAILHSDPDRMYLRMLSHWDEPDQIVLGGLEEQFLFRVQFGARGRSHLRPLLFLLELHD